ncbi:MAG: hypothetical protein C6P35_18000, partial [Cohnella sp.]|uniref:hypothetical protein n=1 Tax=Cohnella sp. TaxID=1883426 RepID=UPI000E3A07BA
TVACASILCAYIGKIQPNAPFRDRKPVYIAYIQSFQHHQPNPHGSRAISLEKMQHTFRKWAKGVRIQHKIQYSRSGPCEVLEWVGDSGDGKEKH